MLTLAYQQGRHEALAKYAAGVDGAVRQILNSPNLKRNLNVAGLGMIAVPSAHSLLSDGEESPEVARAKHISDLAGLGILMGTEYMRH